MELEGRPCTGAPDPQMRVRITETLKGSIDGMQLSRLLKGRVYDLYTSLACYLLSEEVAEPAISEDSALERPAPRGPMFSPSITLPRAVAADRARRTKPKKI